MIAPPSSVPIMRPEKIIRGRSASRIAVSNRVATRSLFIARSQTACSMLQRVGRVASRRVASFGACGGPIGIRASDRTVRHEGLLSLRGGGDGRISCCRRLDRGGHDHFEGPEGDRACATRSLSSAEALARLFDRRFSTCASSASVVSQSGPSVAAGPAGPGAAGAGGALAVGVVAQAVDGELGDHVGQLGHRYAATRPVPRVGPVHRPEHAVREHPGSADGATSPVFCASRIRFSRNSS